MRRDHVTRFRFPVDEDGRRVFQQRLNIPEKQTITRVQIIELPIGVTGWRILSQPFNMSDILPPSITDITPVFCDEGGGFFLELWSETRGNEQGIKGQVDILFTLANAR